MIGGLPLHVLAAIGGFAIGLAYGALAWRTQFCIVGSIYSAVAANDHRGTRSVYLAMAAAIIFTQLLVSLDLVDVSRSVYREPTLHWAGAIFGGLAFGYGMVKASGCGSGSLVNLGGGDLRSLIVLIIMGLFAYMTLNGLTAIPRLALEQASDIDLLSLGAPSQGLDVLVARITGLEADVLRWPISLILAGVIGYFAFRHESFRRSRRHVISGLGVGAIIAAGWLITASLATDPFEPLQVGSLTFVTPIGETILYAVTYTGSTITFGIGAVVGVALGSTIVARLRDEYRLQFPDGDRDLIDGIIGGALMGIGGIFAYGCTIGNGLTGVSALSLGSVMAWAAIMIGGYAAARTKFDVKL